MTITLDGLTVEAQSAPASIDSELAPRIARACGVNADDVVSYRIIRRSLDARKKPSVKILYRVEVEFKPSARPHSSLASDSQPSPDYRVPENMSGISDPVVIGAGPAGLFGGLVLAMAGAKPVILERGLDVEKRHASIGGFLSTRVVDTESNYLFGEGGAGTYSDGKLFTRIRDERMKFVLDEFVNAGADPSIKYFSHPHIGSDRLPSVVRAIRERIISLGGRFVWSGKVESLVIENGVCRGVRLSGGERIDCDKVLAAFGHSARDLILAMVSAGVPHVLKGFQVGVRVEHPQDFVNFRQYGAPGSYPALGAADYSLSSRPSADGYTQGAASFCMCPGGILIPAVCEDGLLCTNGMSNFKRDGEYANAAIVTSIPGESFSCAEEAYNFLRSMEKKAFLLGGGSYTAPAQDISSFISGSKPRLPHGSSYQLGVEAGMIWNILPRSVSASLRRAVIHFDKLMPSYIANGVFVGVETRVSSPVRFTRDEATLETMKNLYVAGEGAGMAGGITSAAIDGMRLAEAMLK